MSQASFRGLKFTPGGASADLGTRLPQISGQSSDDCPATSLSGQPRHQKSADGRNPMPPNPSSSSLLRIRPINLIFISSQKPILRRRSSFLCSCKLEPYTTFKIFRGARGAGLYKKTMAPPRPELEKQYMSSNSKPKKEIAEPKPSASILLISPTNQILLLHRVQTSSSFASAHVFPGGNLSASQDGEIPGPRDGGRHVDGMAYRIGAIRETFEESGILLAKKEDGSLLEVEEGVREKARKEIHAGKLKFQDWVKSLGGVIDSDALYPFTRWITPPNLPKRFTTQMYIYFLPLTQTSAQNITSTYIVPTPTSDGGIEHTAALFASCREWLDQATKGEIILFPPQYYLMHLLSPFLNPSSTPLSTQELQNQRDVVLEFLQGDGDGKGVKWADKVMSPVGLLMRKSDSRSVLSLEKPGPELVGSGRAGDAERVVLVKFSKEGPRDVEVRWRREVLDEEKREKL